MLYLLCGVTILYSLMISLASTSIWLGRNQTLYNFWFYITNFSRYPMEIYNRGWGVAFVGVLYVRRARADCGQRAGPRAGPTALSEQQLGVATGVFCVTGNCAQHAGLAMGVSASTGQLSECQQLMYWPSARRGVERRSGKGFSRMDTESTYLLPFHDVHRFPHPVNARA